MKSQQITKEIRDALWRWYQEKNLTQKTMASFLGVKESSVNDWLNGTAKMIRPKNWIALYPYIKEYLPDDWESPETPEVKELEEPDGFFEIIRKNWPLLTIEQRAELAVESEKMAKGKKSASLEKESFSKIS